jgi:uncharacterized membrane protein YeiH
MGPPAFELPLWFHFVATFVFAVTGAIAALRRNHDVVGVFCLALVTGLGGGLLRDIIVREEPLIFRAGQFYALAAAAGCTVFVTLVARLGVSAPVAGILSVAGTFLFRVAAIQCDWRTSPLRRGR